ncbi:hypothetical protein FE72_15510, partial [Staphylococcus aureus]
PRHPQPDELQRHHHADGPGGQERDPAAGCGAFARGRDQGGAAGGRSRARARESQGRHAIAGSGRVHEGLGHACVDARGA